MSNIINYTRLAGTLVRMYPKASKLVNSNDKQAKNKLVQNLATKALNIFGVEVELINEHNISDLNGAIILPNHQSNVDIFVLLAALDMPLKFVAKKELFKIPLFKKFIKVSESFAFDRNDPRQGVKVFKEAMNAAKAGENIVIFSEGTRSKSPIMSSLNSGLFSFVKKSQVPIIPIYIDGTYDKKKRKVKVIIEKPIECNQYQDKSNVEVMNLVYKSICDGKAKVENKQINLIGLGDSITFGELYDGTYGQGYYQQFAKKLNNEHLLNTEYNYAIPGLSITELEKMIDEDNYEEVYLSKVPNKEIQKMPNITNSIKNSDLLLLTCGANDVLSGIKKIGLTSNDIYDGFERLYEKTKSLVEKINKINNNIKIIFVGLYFPYPHSKALKKFNHMKTLDLYYDKLARKYQNFHKISVYNEVEEHKEKYLPNKRNIHLSEEGYEMIFNKIIKLAQKIDVGK